LGRTIAVTGGQAGVGKTTLAVNLAIALSQARQPAIVLDADPTLTDVEAVLQTGLAGYAGLATVLAGRATLGQVIAPLAGGAGWVAAPPGLARVAGMGLTERSALGRVLEELRARCEWLIVDCGTSAGARGIQRLAGSAELTLVVATPQPTCLTATYAFIKDLSRLQPRPTLGLVINQASSARQARLTAGRINGVAREFLGLHLREYGYIVRESRVPSAVTERRAMLVAQPGCLASACVRHIARRIADNLLANPRMDAGLLGRLFSVLA
jgi:flagellar biosynthesis protein FlhG